ncbi:hypothetical protein INR49_004626 [Caranx melampygus]|nr:hypothetical protein INR49_004626 [Caranx melampygus]
MSESGLTFEQRRDLMVLQCTWLQRLAGWKIKKPFITMSLQKSQRETYISNHVSSCPVIDGDDNDMKRPQHESSQSLCTVGTPSC